MLVPTGFSADVGERAMRLSSSAVLSCLAFACTLLPLSGSAFAQDSLERRPTFEDIDPTERATGRMGPAATRFCGHSPQP